MIQFQHRRGTAAAWVSANPILAQGELGIESGTGQAKLGDGTTHWTGLPYWMPNLDPGFSSFSANQGAINGPLRFYGGNEIGIDFDNAADATGYFGVEADQMVLRMTGANANFGFKLWPESRGVNGTLQDAAVFNSGLCLEVEDGSETPVGPVLNLRNPFGDDLPQGRCTWGSSHQTGMEYQGEASTLLRVWCANGVGDIQFQCGDAYFVRQGEGVSGLGITVIEGPRILMQSPLGDSSIPIVAFDSGNLDIGYDGAGMGTMSIATQDGEAININGDEVAVHRQSGFYDDVNVYRGSKLIVDIIRGNGYTVATLPPIANPGDHVYCTNARNTGESAGAGTGAWVTRGATYWHIDGISTQVQA